MKALNLKRKKVLITGGSSGIGKEVVKMLLSSGAEVHSISRSSSNIVNPNFTEILVDLENIEDALENKLKEVRFVAFDILINNIGTNPGMMNFVDLPMKDISKHLFLNVNVHLFCLKSFKFKKVVFINSVLSQTGVPTNALYCACKAFIYTLNESLRREGMDTLIICPYKVNTSLFSGISDFLVQDRHNVAFEIVNSISLKHNSQFIPFYFSWISGFLNLLPNFVSDFLVKWLFSKLILPSSTTNTKKDE